MKFKKPVLPPALLKVWELTKTIFTWGVMLLAAAMMIFTIVSVTTFDRSDRDLFGYKAFIVRSDSMKASDFAAGDLILVQEVDPYTLTVGDVISFWSTDPNTYGETITHKIRAITTEDGQPAFVTYGTTTNADDQYPVTFDRVVGKYRFTLRGVGTFFAFLKTVPGYVCCILLPFMALIVMQGVNSIKLFRQYKAEQLAEIEAQRQKERDALEAERAALAAEREKLLQLQQSLQAGGPGISPM